MATLLQASQNISDKRRKTTLTTVGVVADSSLESDRGEISTTGCLHGNGEELASSRLAALRCIAVLIVDCVITDEWRRLVTNFVDAALPSSSKW